MELFCIGDSYDQGKFYCETSETYTLTLVQLP